MTRALTVAVLLGTCACGAGGGIPGTGSGSAPRSGGSGSGGPGPVRPAEGSVTRSPTVAEGEAAYSQCLRQHGVPAGDLKPSGRTPRQRLAFRRCQAYTRGGNGVSAEPAGR